MRARSKKRAAQERKYSKVRTEYLYDHPLCEACEILSPFTTSRLGKSSATEIHHKKGRIGDLLTDTEFFLAVCPWCHRWIEEHPKEAKELGLSLSRLSESDRKPWGFCETKPSTCTMNYCDENGCRDRKRNLVNESESTDIPVAKQNISSQVTDNQ